MRTAIRAGLKPAPTPGSLNREGVKIITPLDTQIGKDPMFWERLEQYNLLDPMLKAEGLKKLGIEVSDPESMGILTKSNFVIPGKTRFQCQKCGECCRYARKVATFTYEACPFLDERNECSKHDDRYNICKWFPFWIYTDKRYGTLLTIKPYCTGYGLGNPVNYNATVKWLAELSRAADKDSDGAFVVHELAYLPHRKTWVFPSKKNIDDLLAFVSKGKLLKDETRQMQDTAPHMKAERLGELQHAHHYTSGLLGSINDPHITVNEEGYVTDVNESFCRLSKRERSTIIGRKFSGFFVNPESVSGNILTCISSGKMMAAPQQLFLPDNSATPVLLNAMVFRDRGDGLIHSALVCVNELSPNAYHELAQSRNYARCLIEASLDALVAIDRNGVVSDVNEASVGMTGYSRDELIGSHFKNYFDDPVRAQQGVEFTFARGQVKNYELNLVNRDGELISVSFNATVYRDAQGVVQGVFASARDVRETRRMIKELEEAHNYARGLIESGVDLMVTVNRDGIVTDVNEAAVRMTGYSRNELIGSKFKDYFVDSDRARNGVDLTFSSGQVSNYELDLMNRNGGLIPVSFNAVIYRDTVGSVKGVFAVARDIRETRRMISELEEARNYARGLIESGIDLMVTVNRDGVVTDVNEAAVSMTGRSRESLIGSYFKNYFDNSIRAQEGVNLTFSKGQVRNYDLDLKNGNDGLIPVSFNATVYRDTAGAVQGVFAVARSRKM